jgi:cyclophilin family peptidyl-prolyl cis-trans isomerase
MTPARRLVFFFLGVLCVACAPLNHAKLQARAAADSLAATRDSLRSTRDSLRHFALDATTPDSFLVAFETTRGRFDVMAHSSWAPVGADRFYALVRRGFYDSTTVFRVVKGFVAQFGISGNPNTSAAWENRTIGDDRTRVSNLRGRVSYASGGAGTRTTQLFINLRDNPRLDALGGFGYPPFGEVVKGMDVVDSLYNEYGEAPSGRQDSIIHLGNEYLRRNYPKLDMIRTARVIQAWGRQPGG